MDHVVLDQLLADPALRLCGLPRDMLQHYMHLYVPDDKRGITHGRLPGSLTVAATTTTPPVNHPVTQSLYRLASTLRVKTLV